MIVIFVQSMAFGYISHVYRLIYRDIDNTIDI